MNDERKNRVIFIRIPGWLNDGVRRLNEWVSYLPCHGIEIKTVTKTGFGRLEFTTEHTRVRIIPSEWLYENPDRISGLRCDECFGFNERDTAYLRFDRNPENAYKGSFLEYICEVEGVNRD